MSSHGKELDYIIVGAGIAGLSFTRLLERQKRSFVIIDDGIGCATNIAGGLYNPVFVRHLKKVRKAEDALFYMSRFLRDMDTCLQESFSFTIDIYKLLNTQQQHTEWLHADKTRNPFLADTILDNDNPYIISPFGMGIIKGSGRVNMPLLKQKYTDKLSKEDKFLKATFDYDRLKLTSQGAVYGDLSARKVIFSEGVRILKNPFFNHLTLKGNKGEWLKIYAPDLNTDHILRSSLFVMPLGGDIYKIGSTYDGNYDNDLPTTTAKKEIIRKFESLYSGSYDILDHKAGIRPVTPSRRALLGCHPLYKQLVVFNGLGSRGMLYSPYLAECLYQFLERQIPLSPEVNI